jgi:hypothetical protein
MRENGVEQAFRPVEGCIEEAALAAEVRSSLEMFKPSAAKAEILMAAHRRLHPISPAVSHSHSEEPLHPSCSDLRTPGIADE